MDSVGQLEHSLDELVSGWLAGPRQRPRIHPMPESGSGPNMAPKTIFPRREEFQDVAKENGRSSRLPRVPYWVRDMLIMRVSRRMDLL